MVLGNSTSEFSHCSAQTHMIDRDLIGLAMQEAQRLNAEPVGPNPFKGEPAIEALREVLDRKQEPRTIADQPDLLAGLDLGTAIHLRWVLRDIKGKRTKFMGVNPGDLRTLTEMGL